MSKELKIDLGQYVVTADKHNFILNKKGVAGKDAKEPGKATLTAIGFYGCMSHLCTELVRLELRESDARALSHLIMVLRECEEIIQQIDNHKQYKI